MERDSRWEECPTCTTQIPLCARCGARYPMHGFADPLRGYVSWPAGFTHMTSNRDIRLCERCVNEFRYLAHQWAGESTEALDAWARECGMPPAQRYELVPVTYRPVGDHD